MQFVKPLPYKNHKSGQILHIGPLRLAQYYLYNWQTYCVFSRDLISAMSNTVTMTEKEKGETLPLLVCTKTASALSWWSEQFPTMSPPVVCWSNTLEFLLASSVPAVKHKIKMNKKKPSGYLLHETWHWCRYLHL